ncbi:hypothetical protein L249_8027, partial [Ophiocordyceps polyrhachis-furcata BCC 54312]
GKGWSAPATGHVYLGRYLLAQIGTKGRTLLAPSLPFPGMEEDDD